MTPPPRRCRPIPSFPLACPIGGPAVALAALSAAVFVLAGCRGDPPPDDVPIEVGVSVAPTPPIVGPVRLVLTITDEQGAPVEDARVLVEGTMTHAGMTPVQDTATYQGQGRWVVPEFEFTMGGDWILTTRITLPDGREAVRQREFNVVGAPPPTSDPEAETEG